MVPSLASAESECPAPAPHDTVRPVTSAELNRPPLDRTQPSLPVPPVDPVHEGPPPGCHAERRYILGLIAPGSIITLFGGGFLAAGIEGNASKDEDLRRARDHGADARERAAATHEFDDLFITIGAVHVAVGIPLIALGLLVPHHVYVADELKVAFVPVVTSQRAGGAFVVSF
jgi:hypothetical protein